MPKHTMQLVVSSPTEEGMHLKHAHEWPSFTGISPVAIHI